MHRLGDFSLMEYRPRRRHDQLVLPVVFAADGAYHLAVKPLQGPVHAQNVGVLFLSVAAGHAGDIAVVDRIHHALMHRADGPVYFHMNGAAQQGIQAFFSFVHSLSSYPNTSMAATVRNRSSQMSSRP